MWIDTHRRTRRESRRVFIIFISSSVLGIQEHLSWLVFAQGSQKVVIEMWARISDIWKLERCWGVMFLFQCQQDPYQCLQRSLASVSPVVKSLRFQNKPNKYLLKEAWSPNLF